jgi:hypothetical protein
MEAEPMNGDHDFDPTTSVCRACGIAAKAVALSCKWNDCPGRHPWGTELSTTTSIAEELLYGVNPTDYRVTVGGRRHGMSHMSLAKPSTTLTRGESTMLFNYAIVGTARAASHGALEEETLLEHGTKVAASDTALRNRLLIEVVPGKLEEFKRDRQDLVIGAEDVEVLVRPFCSC